MGIPARTLDIADVCWLVIAASMARQRGTPAWHWIAQEAVSLLAEQELKPRTRCGLPGAAGSGVPGPGCRKSLSISGGCHLAGGGSQRRRGVSRPQRRRWSRATSRIAFSSLRRGSRASRRSPTRHRTCPRSRASGHRARSRIQSRHGTLSLLAGIDHLPDRYMPASKTATARASSSAFSRGSMRPTPPIPRSRSSWTVDWRIMSRKPRDSSPLGAGLLQLCVHAKAASSSLNLVEGFFSKMARSVLRHIRVASKAELKQRIIARLDDLDRQPVVPRRLPQNHTPSAIESFRAETSCWYTDSMKPACCRIPFEAGFPDAVATYAYQETGGCDGGNSEVVELPLGESWPASIDRWSRGRRSSSMVRAGSCWSSDDPSCYAVGRAVGVTHQRSSVAWHGQAGSGSLLLSTIVGLAKDGCITVLAPHGHGLGVPGTW